MMTVVETSDVAVGIRFGFSYFGMSSPVLGRSAGAPEVRRERFSALQAG